MEQWAKWECGECYVSWSHLSQRVSRKISQSTDWDNSEQSDQRAARNFKPKKKSPCLQCKVEKALSWEDLVRFRGSCKSSSLILPCVMYALLSEVKRLSHPPPFSSLLLPLQQCETQTLQVCLPWWRQAGCNPLNWCFVASVVEKTGENWNFSRKQWHRK